MSDAAVISYTHIRTRDLYTDFQAVFQWWALTGTRGFCSACLYVCRLCSGLSDKHQTAFQCWRQGHL